MAETLLSFGVQNLLDLLVREAERFKGVDEQFTQLKIDVKLLRSFLQDAEAKQENQVVKTCVEDIKEIVLDAEDIIETFIQEGELIKSSCIKILEEIRHRRKFAEDTRDISKRISVVIGNMEKFGVISKVIVEWGESSNSLQKRLSEMRKTFPSISSNENNPVGLEDNVEKLVDYLVKDDSGQVIAITGMGGIGKSTLARQAFNDERVKNHFSGLAWVCLSKDFQRQNVWKSIFQKLSSKDDEQRGSNMNEDELQEKLFGLLETSKSLIVLDDIWEKEDWDKVRHVFPPNKGCKVILTSRYKSVALHADPTCNLIEPDFLTPDESWELFQRILFPRKDTTEYNIDVEMEKLGKQMIKHCKGLPLAIKVLGGLLAAQNTLSEWKRLSKNIRSRIINSSIDSSSVYHILSLSFEELPNYLKHCFLYLAHFPEDYIIDVGMLSYLWASEGILTPRPTCYHERTTREVADECIEELVRRNMVISGKDESMLRSGTFRLHDVMREVCRQKAEEEDFVLTFDSSASNPTSQSPYKSRRLVIDSYPIPVDMNGYIKNPKLRSLLYIHQSCKHWVRISFTRLKLMRVLDLSYALFEGKKLPPSIGELIHLRYLSLRNAEVSHLPSSMQNLKKLLYLNLDVDEACPMYVPRCENWNTSLFRVVYMTR